MTSTKKIRDFGSIPSKEAIAKCEACGLIERIIWTAYLQCPECGRYLCSNCWDEEKGLCVICSQDIPSKNSLEVIRKEIIDLSLKIEILQKNVESIQKSSDKINSEKSAVKHTVIEKAVKNCPHCKSEVPSDHIYCFICGSKLKNYISIDNNNP